MKEDSMQKQAGEHFAAAHLGPFSDLAQYGAHIPALGMRVPGKVFLREHLPLTGAEISFNKLPPGFAIPFLHRHRLHEEIIIVMRGTGEVLVDGAVIPVREGSVVAVRPEGARTLRNNGSGHLDFMVLQVRANSIEQDGTEDSIAVMERPLWPG